MTETIQPATTSQSIVQALSSVMADVGPVAKAQRNEQHNFNFRGIDAVVNAASPALVKHGVVVVPELQAKEYGTVEVGRNRTRMAHCQVEVIYRFYGPDGSSIPVKVPGEAMDSGDKATAKAMSVAFRTALIQALSLPTDEADPDTQVYERSAPQATDHEWLTEVENRVAATTEVSKLQAIAKEIDAKRESGACEDIHYEHLWALGEQRHKELTSALQNPQPQPDQALPPRAQQQSPPPAPETPSPPAESSVEGTLTQQYTSRLAKAVTAAALQELKAAVMADFKAQKLNPTDGNKLLREIRGREYDLEESAA